VAPLAKVLGILRENGCSPVLSIEIFNREYWKQYDAATLASRGLESMKRATANMRG
jgi:sugar phosphate isomerase/epimerase